MMPALRISPLSPPPVASTFLPSIRSNPHPSTHLRLRQQNLRQRLQSFSSTRLLNSIPQPPSLLIIKDIPAPHTGFIRILSLNSPSNRNALSRQLVGELAAEIEALRREAEGEEKGGEKGRGGEAEKGGLTRCLVLASELDNVFCSGADLKERREMSREDITDFLTSLRQTFNNLSSLPIPSICAISSIALGGGLELALASTFRVFSASASVGLPESRIAVIPGAGGTYRLRRLIGEARAMEMILTGRFITGAQAWKIGMCERLVSDDQTGSETGATEIEQYAKRREAVFETALKMAMRICHGAPGVMGPAMRAVKAGHEEAENEQYNSILDTEDRLEALAAFIEKRKPVFHGR